MDNTRQNAYISSLQRMVRVPTVSDPAHLDPKTFEEFRTLLEDLFPNVHKVCELRKFDDALLYKWPGSGTEELPVLFMNHHDVVPADPPGWEHPPFDAEIADGKIWGRGTLDDKGGLFAMFQAAEELIREGFVPEKDIWFETGGNEETSGSGAAAAASWLEEQGIRLEMVFDEGGDVVYDPIGGADGTFGMIGVGEKCVVDMKFIARSDGGHASTPEKDTPLVRLGKFMAYMERRQLFDTELSPTAAEMLKRFAPYMGKAGKVAGNDRAKWLLEKVLPRFGAAAGALLSTTVAFTMCCGGEAVNAIPREAWVIGDMRCSHHQGVEGSLSKIRKAAEKFGLETEIIDLGAESRIADYKGKAFRLVEEAVKETLPEVDACAPYIMNGASDARFFDKVCDQCIRFLPFRISAEQMNAVHGINECLDLDTIVPAVDYYKYMLRHV